MPCPWKLRLSVQCEAGLIFTFHLQLEDTKQFRQLHSKTPGHPENFITDGVEVTTGRDLLLT